MNPVQPGLWALLWPLAIFDPSKCPTAVITFTCCPQRIVTATRDTLNLPVELRTSTMRLLNFDTMEIDTFAGSQLDTPAYAILSHTWFGEKEELIFEEWNPAMIEKALSTMKAPAENARMLYDTGRERIWAKFIGFCKRALNTGYHYGWIDTLCINKRVRWFTDATLC